MLSVIRSISLSEQVVERVRTAIIEGHLKPGDRITEAMLTEMLGISRTPIREALILLVREGLLITESNKATFVRAFNSKDVTEIFTFRTTLENFAGELLMDLIDPQGIQHLQSSIEQQHAALEAREFKIVRSIDMAFHEYLVSRSGHALLLRNWREIVAPIAAILYLRAEAIHDYDEYQSIRDHTAIVEAYQTHDLEKLKTLNQQINQRVAVECIRALPAVSTFENPAHRKHDD